MTRRRRDLRPIVDELDDRCLLSVSSGLTPAEITAAYGLSGITFTSSSGTAVKADGSGETIALIEMYHDPNLASDLHTFDQQYGLPDPTFNVINQAGTQTNIGRGQEESLDVEWAHAIAPGASILVIEAAPGTSDSQALQNLMTAVQAASTPSTISTLNIPPVAVVSMSWGFNEFPGETLYDPGFTTPGITYIAASGDSPGAEYPAVSPDVLAVGGTTVTLGSSGGYGSETAWYDSGGGYSQYESEPAYQESVQTTGQRSTPDVAFDGDPNTGAMVYYTPPAGGGRWQSGAPQGAWYAFGGTSLGAPAWAGIIALVDQGRVQSGQSNLSGATQTLPSLYSLASTSASAADFHSIAASPTSTPWTGGGWGGVGGRGDWGWGWSPGTSPTGSPTSGATANTQTGLGTPDGPSLINSLVASTITTALPSPSPSPAPSPSPSPVPTPSPTPAPPGGKHHHHKPPHGKAQHKAHAATVHANRVVKQVKPAVKGHSLDHHL
jgi:subtilase family serine protease